MNAWAGTPQAAEIDALIERAGRLSTEEAAALAGSTDVQTAFGVAGRVAGRVAALDAAWDAAWDAARDAARNASLVAARVAARNTARAAVALVVRDLIDEATDWNRDAYDHLTHSWAAVIGPAHPDDVQVEVQS